MRDKKKKKDFVADAADIQIDYENIDVEDIMNQIKKKVETRLKEQGLDSAAADEAHISPPSGSLPPEETPESPSGVKAFLSKIMKPISPVIKLLVFPVHQEVRENIQNLDYTNRRLDVLTEHLNGALDELRMNLDRFNSVTNERVDMAFEDLTRAKEYVKLLHSLSHNIVVELTKLKIEEDNLKNRIRVLEKDFESLKTREKALESRLIQ
jgi:hypothetical protein